MATFNQNWRLLAAILVATALIIGAFIAATDVFRTTPVVASTETALLQAIATKDSDGDELTDWEEGLYGTDPAKVDSKGLGMSDGEAVKKGLIIPEAPTAPAPTTSSGTIAGDSELVSPAQGSLTAAFSQVFFSYYLTAVKEKDGKLTEEDTAAIAQKAVDELTRSVGKSPDFKMPNEIKVSGSGAEAMRAYAAAAEDVFRAYAKSKEKSELLYLQDLVMNDDLSAIPNIQLLAKSYRDVAAGLAALSVPQEVASAHLALVNAMARIGNISEDFSRVKSDPLVSVLALNQYPVTVLEMGNALIQINKLFTEQNIVVAPGTPGAFFVNVIPNVAQRQAAEEQP